MGDLPWYVRVLLAFTLVGLLATTLVFSFIENDAGTRNLVVGAILGYVAAVVQFYFGSSEGSRTKDDTLAAATAALAVSTPPHREPEVSDVRQDPVPRP
jgi:uncharacterized membrane protein YjjB (DUF3815 family)